MPKKNSSILFPFNTHLWLKPPDIKNPKFFSSYTLDYRLNNSIQLLINGLTGAVDAISHEDFKTLMESPMEFVSKHPNKTHMLVQRGYLFESNEQEKLLKSSLIAQIRRETSKQETIFMLCPTDYCPMGCSYCFGCERPREASRNTMSEAMVAQVFETMQNIIKNKPRKLSNVILYGGEPFQKSTLGIIKTIFEMSRHYGLRIGAFSNGYDLMYFKELLHEYKSDILVISITLDGLREKHDAIRSAKSSYDRAVQSIDMLMEIGVPVKVKMNANKANIFDIPEVMRFYKKKGWWNSPNIDFEVSGIQYGGISIPRDTTTNIELGLDFLDLMRSDPELGKIDFLPLIDNKYHLLSALVIHEFPAGQIPANAIVPRIHNCPSYSQHMFVFGADGRIYLCNEQVGVDSACYGKIDKKTRLDENRMNEHFRRDVTSMSPCKTCSLAFFCGGGCGHHSKDESPFCAKLKEDFQMVIDHYRDRIYNRLFEKTS